MNCNRHHASWRSAHDNPNVLWVLMAACVATAQAAPLPAEWQHEQRFDAPSAGLLKLSLPTATLDAARPGMEDLRIYDDAGREVPYLLERPKPASKVVRDAKSFQASVNAATTVRRSSRRGQRRRSGRSGRW